MFILSKTFSDEPDNLAEICGACTSLKDIETNSSFLFCDEHGPFCFSCVPEIGYWNPQDYCCYCANPVRINSDLVGNFRWKRETEEALRKHLIDFPEPDFPLKTKTEHPKGDLQVYLTVSSLGNVVCSKALNTPIKLHYELALALSKARFEPFLSKDKTKNMSVSGKINFSYDFTQES